MCAEAALTPAVSKPACGCRSVVLLSVCVDVLCLCPRVYVCELSVCGLCSYVLAWRSACGLPRVLPAGANDDQHQKPSRSDTVCVSSSSLCLCLCVCVCVCVSVCVSVCRCV